MARGTDVGPDLGWTVLGVPIDSRGRPRRRRRRSARSRPRRRCAATGSSTGSGRRDAGDLEVRITGPGARPEAGHRRLAQSLAGDEDAVRRPRRTGAHGRAAAAARRLLRAAHGRRRRCAGRASAAVGWRQRRRPRRRLRRPDLPDRRGCRHAGRGAARHRWPGLLGRARPGTCPARGADIVVLGARDRGGGARHRRAAAAARRRASSAPRSPRTRQRRGSLAELRRRRLLAAPRRRRARRAGFPATDYLMPGGIDLPLLADVLRAAGRGRRCSGSRSAATTRARTRPGGTDRP